MGSSCEEIMPEEAHRSRQERACFGDCPKLQHNHKEWNIIHTPSICVSHEHHITSNTPHSYTAIDSYTADEMACICAHVSAYRYHVSRTHGAPTENRSPNLHRMLCSIVIQLEGSTRAQQSHKSTPFGRHHPRVCCGSAV